MRGKSLSWLIVGLVVGISLITSACAPAAPTTPGPAPGEVTHLTLAGGSIGGFGNVRLNCVAGVANKYLGIDTTVIVWPTLGFPRALHEGIADIAGSLDSCGYEAYTGTGDFAGEEPYLDLRGYTYTWERIFQIFVLKGSDIKTFSDIRGKRVSAGEKGFASDMIWSNLCDALGLSRETDMEVLYMGHKEAGAALIAGKLDVYATTGSPPHPTFAEVDLMHPLVLVSLTKEEGEAIVKKYPRYAIKEIPPIYYHMDEPAQVVTEPSGEMVTTRLSEDLVYRLLKNHLEHPEFAGYYHVSLKDAIEDGSVKKWNESLISVPYHAGAYRYFKELGWDIPEEMIPPEAK